MAAVVVTIAGRTYRVSCEDGEEPRLEQLARYVDGKILSMRDSFGEIGEQRSVVMAALTIADEATDARGKSHAMELDVAALRLELEAARKASMEMEERLTKALDDAAQRMERMAADLQKADAPLDDFL